MDIKSKKYKILLSDFDKIYNHIWIKDSEILICNETKDGPYWYIINIITGEKKLIPGYFNQKKNVSGNGLFLTEEGIIDLNTLSYINERNNPLKSENYHYSFINREGNMIYSVSGGKLNTYNLVKDETTTISDLNLLFTNKGHTIRDTITYLGYIKQGREIILSFNDSKKKRDFYYAVNLNGQVREIKE